MLFEAIHLNQQLQRPKQLFFPYSLQPMKWNSVHTKIINLYFEEIFNVTYVVSVLVSFQLQNMEHFTPTDLLKKEIHALGPLEVGRVSRGAVSANPPFIWSCFILRSASLSGARLRQSQASPSYKVTSKERVCLSQGFYPRSKDFSF